MEMRKFEVPQSYETTVAMRDSEGEMACEFLFMCLPVSAIHERNRQLLDNPAELLTELLPAGEAEARELRVAQLPDAIFTVLEAGAAGEEAGSVLDLVSSPDWLARQREEDPAGALFAEYLAFAEVVPFEQSKLSASPAASLAMKSYKPAEKTAEVAGFAPVLGPHGAVVF
jgi:hypothetical protein